MNRKLLSLFLFLPIIFIFVFGKPIHANDNYYYEYDFGIIKFRMGADLELQYLDDTMAYFGEEGKEVYSYPYLIMSLVPESVYNELDRDVETAQQEALEFYHHLLYEEGAVGQLLEVNKEKLTLTEAYVDEISTRCIRIAPLGNVLLSMNYFAQDLTQESCLKEIDRVLERTEVNLTKELDLTAGGLFQFDELNTDVPDFKVQLQIGNEHILVGEEVLPLIGTPYINNGTTMVPLAAIDMIFPGTIITWEPSLKQATVIHADGTFYVRAGSNQAVVNQEQVKMDVAVEIKDGRTLFL